MAARFVEDPRATLVVTAGEDAADTFARTVGAFVGEERVLRFADYEGNPFSLDAPMHLVCMVRVSRRCGLFRIRSL